MVDQAEFDRSRKAARGDCRGGAHAPDEVNYGDRDPVFMGRVLGTVPCRRTFEFVGSCRWTFARDGHG